MSDKGQQEPSMEEILASIRRIISEDGDAPGKEEEAPPPPPPPPPSPPPPPPPPPPPASIFEPEEEDDVLELTQVAAEEPAMTLPEEPDDYDPWKIEEPAPPPPPPPPRPSFFDEVDEPPPPPRPKAAPRRLAEGDNGLISRSTADIASSHLTHLARELGDDLSIGPMPIGIRSVEDVVRELLRPLLKEWLDENLPTVVERLVQQEIDRMIRRSQKF